MTIPHNKGKKMTAEQRAKLRGIKKPSLRGNKNAQGHVPWNKGKTWSEEWREEQSKRIKKYHEKRGKSNHPRTGHSKDRFYVQWRTSVFERDSFICQVCHQVGGLLNAHHIKAWAYFPEERYDIDNGITLCKPCHDDIHRRK